MNPLFLIQKGQQRHNIGFNCKENVGLGETFTYDVM